VDSTFFALLDQQLCIQNRKSITTYKINTLSYVICFWQLVVACHECFISEFSKGNIFAAELDVKYFTTANLFIININSVFEQIVR